MAFERFNCDNHGMGCPVCRTHYARRSILHSSSPSPFSYDAPSASSASMPYAAAITPSPPRGGGGSGGRLIVSDVDDEEDDGDDEDAGAARRQEGLSWARGVRGGAGGGALSTAEMSELNSLRGDPERSHWGPPL